MRLLTPFKSTYEEEPEKRLHSPENPYLFPVLQDAYVFTCNFLAYLTVELGDCHVPFSLSNSLFLSVFA